MKQLNKIHRFIRYPNYQASTSLNYVEQCLERYKENYHLELDPDFQRAHVWTQDQQIRYVEYLFKGGNFSRDILFNMPHWGTGRNDVGNMVLVDGKQRIQAVLLFLHNQLPIFGSLFNEWDDAKIVCRGIDLIFRVNSLLTRKVVLQWYLDLNTGGTIHTNEEIEKVRKLYKKECKNE
jgi:hypothetical protein